MDGQRDLVAEDLAAAREVHVPVEAVVVTVDLAFEVDPDPVVAVCAGYRAVDLAAGDDRLGDALDGQLAVDDDLAVLGLDAVRLE